MDTFVSFETLGLHMLISYRSVWLLSVPLYSLNLFPFALVLRAESTDWQYFFQVKWLSSLYIQETY